MITNTRLREVLEEIDANYKELITISKEFLIIKRPTQQMNEELTGQNKELKSRFNSWMHNTLSYKKYHKHSMDCKY